MCDCISMVNEHLAAYNTHVTTTIALVENNLAVVGVKLATHKIDSERKGKPLSLTAAYCPFCGQKYENAKEETNA